MTSNSKDKKIKVGFYSENIGYPKVDCRSLEKGNPGLGGTQYSEIATANYLQTLFPKTVEIYLFVQLSELMPAAPQVIQVKNIKESVVKAHEFGCEILVFRSTLINQELCGLLEKYDIKAIVRSDDWLSFEKLSLIFDCHQVKCNVCFSDEQLDHYRDHRIFPKSTCIYHPLNIDSYLPQKTPSKESNTVVFLGNIIPVKGFHILARIWPKIIKEKPDAKLIVIGSGKLYNRNQKLGKWGIAEESYEASSIRPYLSNKDGKVIESVEFLGLVPDKNPILQQADVGIVNPSGKAEVFCISAIEFQAAGTPVISAPKGGLLDTIIDKKTGFHVKSDQELMKSILYFLNNPTITEQFSQNSIKFVKKTFDYQLIAKQWLDLITTVSDDRPIVQRPMKSNYFYKFKIIKEIMRVLKNKISPFKKIPSLIEIEYQLKSKIKSFKR